MSAQNDHRALWQPKLPEVAKQCASCPFRIGNDKEFGEVITRLRCRFGMSEKVRRADIQHARLRVRIDSEHGDFVCHHTAYDGEMEDRPHTDYRQCAGATQAFRSRFPSAK